MLSMLDAPRKSNQGANMPRICNICEERELRPGSKLPACSVCRGNMGGWVRRGVAAILDYRRKLQIRETRMDYLVDDERQELTAKQRARLASQPMGAKSISTAPIVPARKAVPRR
jgi:hypothetical protein